MLMMILANPSTEEREGRSPFVDTIFCRKYIFLNIFGMSLTQLNMHDVAMHYDDAVVYICWCFEIRMILVYWYLAFD